MNDTLAIAMGIIAVLFIVPAVGILLLVMVDRWTARSSWTGDPVRWRD